MDRSFRRRLANSVLVFTPQGYRRVVFTWGDNAPKNQWLGVTVKANANTGLSVPDVFYFGNLVGESYFAVYDGEAVITALDLSKTKARMDQMQPATITELCDYNRDALVDQIDLDLVKANLNHSMILLSAPV